MTRPVVSYLLVAYKSNATIGQAVESIISQTGDFKKEIVVVDNCPAESCAAIVVKVASGAKVVVNPTNRGFTQAVNQAVANSRGNYLFFLNPDVRLFPDCTEALIDALAEDVSVAAAAPQLLSEDGSLQCSVRNFPTFSTLLYEHSGLSRLFPRSPLLARWRNRYFDHAARSYVKQPMASALLVRREVMRAVGEWDERFFVFFSDVDICKRIHEAGYRILFVPEAKAHHRLGGSTSQEGSWLILDSHRGFYRYLAKHELNGVKVVLRPAAVLILSASAVLRVLLRWLRRRRF